MEVTRHTWLEYRRRVSLAMNHISSHLGEDLTLEEIASAASFSVYHFHRIFKAVVGETVSEFTWRLRLEQAANRLLAGRQSITRIAADCGFSSSQNFAKAFRQRFGMTPSAYRISKMGNIVSKPENVFSFPGMYDADIEANDFLPKSWKSGMRVEIMDMPEYSVAFVRKMGPYKRTTTRAVDELMQWAGPGGRLKLDMLFGIIYWDNPEVTPPEKCRLDAFIGVPAGTQTQGQVGLQKIAGGPYAVCRFAVTADGFQQAWEDAFVWLVHSGYESDDGPCYESYHNNGDEHPEGKWFFDICIPLKRD